MKLLLWTAAPGLWPGAVSSGAGRLSLVAAETAERPAADLDVYHLRDDPAFAFVYRALLERPGLLVLDSFRLHALVHAQTAARGDAGGFLRLARREQGRRGVFIARQLLRGQGGAIAPLLALNEDALASALGVLTRDDSVLEQLRRWLRDETPVRRLSQGSPETLLSELLALAQEAVSRREVVRARLEEERRAAATTRGRALLELRPLARELGLRQVPAAAVRAIESLLRS